MLIADRKIFFLFYFLLRYLLFFLFCFLLRYLPEMESRTQGSRPGPRPRTQKNPRPRTAFPRTDIFEAKDRNARCQGPRTQAQVFSKKKKKGLHKNFSGDPKKEKKIGLDKNFSSDLHKKAFSKKFFKRFTKFLQFKN